MPAIVAAVMVGLAWLTRFMVAKVMIALGLQLVTFAGLDFALDWAIDQAFANLNALDSQVYNIVRICRIPDAIAVITAAMLVKQSLVLGLPKLWRVAGST